MVTVITKVLVFFIIFAITILIKEGLLFYIAYKSGKKIDYSVGRQVLIASSISYILTLTITGIL